MADVKETIAKVAINVASAAGAAAAAAGLIPSVNDYKPSPTVTKEERALATIRKQEQKDAIKNAQKRR